MTFGQRLSDIRKDNGHTQQDLADILCVSKHTVASWEQDKNSVPMDVLIRICELYEVSADFLLGLSHDPGRKISRFSKAELEKILDYEKYIIYQRRHKK